MSKIQAKALDPDSLEVESYPLDCPSLNEVAEALQSGLKSNFQTVSVQVVECPDLTKEPFRFAAPGLGGSPCLADVGGVPNLVPLAKKDKLYDLLSLPKLTKFQEKDQLIIGAGAAPWTFLNRNAELIPNLLVKKDGSFVQESRIAFTRDSDDSYHQKTLPPEETKLSLLGNLFLSQGQSGLVLEIRCKTRTGQENFVSAIRKTLLQKFPERVIGLGGTFLIKSGKVKIHVMPDFSTCPLMSDEEVAKWLKFYEMSSPFVCGSFLITKDPGLDLRIEHSHGFSDHGDAGHYHYDTTPEEVEYIGYFNLAEVCYRIDRPKETHNVGRD